MFEEEFLPISPLPFFQVRASCHYIDPSNGSQEIKRKEYRLPSMEKITQEFHFAHLNMGWNSSGLYFYCETTIPFQDAFYPDFTRGDSLELFIDTRDVKTSGFTTKFCHHFFFLPKGIEGHSAEEVTRFRTEDAHEFCDPRELIVKTELNKHGYQLNIFIPAHCLHGYDPDQFQRLGFTYRINRMGANPQHFSVLSNEFKIEQQPSLWASLSLSKIFIGN